MSINNKRIEKFKGLVTFTPNKPLPLVKSLLKGLTNSSGRNNMGKITVYHKGGGHKRKYRQLNFKNVSDEIGIVTSIEYDPNRNCSILSIYNMESKRYSYRLAPKGSRVGDIIKTGAYSELRLGHSMALKKIPVGSCVHCISPTKNSNGTISRSAGTFTTLKSKTSKNVEILVSSGTILHMPATSYATLGIVSTNNKKGEIRKKAGRSRWLNIRPTVRGVAMNPIDHPHGGGEGKTSGGRTSVTPWGKPSKGKGKKNHL